jgi:hypothetical protein
MALIGVALVAVSVVASYAMGKEVILKQDLSADFTEVHLVQLRKNTCDWNWGWTFKNTGSVPITSVDGRIRQDNGADWSVSASTPGGAASPGESRKMNWDGCSSNITPGRSYQAQITIYYQGTQLQSRAYAWTIVAEGL